jgi:primosomal protein N' (replication factor Y)
MSLLPFHDADEPTDSAGSAPPEDARFVRVVIERAFDQDEGWTYWSDQDLEVGRLVHVPMGRGDTTTPGVVVTAGGRELAEGFDLRRIKRIRAVKPVTLGPLQLELCRWIAAYYACPLGVVFAGAVPKGVRSRTGLTNVELIERADPIPEPFPKLPPTAREALERVLALPNHAFPIEKKSIKHTLELRSIAPVNALIKAGILVESSVERVRTPSVFKLLDEPERPTPSLTPDQQRVIDDIDPTLGRFGVHLVHGVTGSGKTELYMRLIERVLARGKTALVLVPEIALTPQTAGRFVSRFRDIGVALLHSGMSAGARHAQWSLVEDGSARVVVGARSAIFAPIRDLGIVVVDEEHDSSYKQDRSPRYHARDCAVMLSNFAKCPCVLGSATPSLESWSNTVHKGWTRHTLGTRATGGSMPKVQIVDRTQDRPSGATHGSTKPVSFPIVGRRLEQAVHETLERHEQVILLLNRRGYASMVASADPKCDWVLRCDQCDAAMVVHKSLVRTRRGSRFVRCHHCANEQLIPETCPETGKGVVQLGVGTQRVEDELVARFGERHGLVLGDSLVRVDSDTMHSASDYFTILDRFSRGQIRMMLGTQMIAKGLDFPNVTLVAVLNADTALGIPDFRAEERTFQLVAQVAGRAGRGEREGRVIVQTMNPRSDAITLAAAHDYPRFADRELRIRERSGLPPSTRMARIVVRDEDARGAEERADEIAKSLAQHADPRVTITGPFPCVITRISNEFRFSVELLAPGPTLITRALESCRRGGALASDPKVMIDVDPLWML